MGIVGIIMQIIMGYKEADNDKKERNCKFCLFIYLEEDVFL